MGVLATNALDWAWYKIVEFGCYLGHVCVQNIVVLKPNNIGAIYCYTPNFSDQLAITVHHSSIVREFILPIWSQTFLINSRLNLRFQQPWNNWKWASWNPIRFMRDPSLPKAPVFEVFHTHSFSPCCSLNQTVFIWEVWSCLCVGRAERETDTDTEGRNHTSRLSNSRENETRYDTESPEILRHSHYFL